MQKRRDKLVSRNRQTKTIYVSKQLKNSSKKGREIINKHKNIGETSCFNNNKIHIDHTIQMDLKSGNTVANKS